MTRRTDMTVILLLSLMCYTDVITSAAAGYFYEQPIRPFNAQPYTGLPAAGPYANIQIGQKAGVGIASTPAGYILGGRELKQYEVYEQIDNDIDQDVPNFIPANFFVSNYHARISPTHPLASDFQVQTRASRQRFHAVQQIQQKKQQQAQQIANSIAIGSGGLGFVKLPNGNVYLGSGSLGYISSLQRLQDVEEARTRTGASTPDALHFGHGPLSDSSYFQ